MERGRDSDSLAAEDRLRSTGKLPGRSWLYLSQPEGGGRWHRMPGQERRMWGPVTSRQITSLSFPFRFMKQHRLSHHSPPFQGLPAARTMPQM